MGIGIDVMMKPISPQKRLWIKEFVGRLDHAAGNLNVVLLVVALGLATLDFTFLVTQKVVDSLPQVTRVSYVDAPSADQQKP